MDILIVVLQVLLYLAGILILVVFSIVGLKLVKLLDKTDKILDEVDEKVQSLDNIFEVVDKVGYGLNKFTSSIVRKVNSISLLKDKLKKRKDDIDE